MKSRCGVCRGVLQGSATWSKGRATESVDSDGDAAASNDGALLSDQDDDSSCGGLQLQVLSDAAITTDIPDDFYIHHQAT